MRKEAAEKFFVHSAEMNPRVLERRLFRLLKKAQIKAGLCEIPFAGLPKILGPANSQATRAWAYAATSLH